MTYKFGDKVKYEGRSATYIGINVIGSILIVFDTYYEGSWYDSLKSNYFKNHGLNLRNRVHCFGSTTNFYWVDRGNLTLVTQEIL